MSDPTHDRISVFIPDVRVFELQVADEVFNNAAAQNAGAVATELTIFVDPANSQQQGNNDGDSGINIDQTRENLPAHGKVVQLITRAIKDVGVLTMAAVVHAVHSEPASGVVFGHNKLAYNVTLTAIFSLGVAEYITSLLISTTDGLTNRRRQWIGGMVLFLSIWLYVGIHMGGFA